MTQLIRFNEACALQRNERFGKLQKTGLTVGAAAPRHAPARSNRAFAPVAWLLFSLFLFPDQGAMAAKMLVQRPHLRAAPAKPALASQAENPKTQPDAPLGADFLQLNTETTDNATAETAKASKPVKLQWPWIRPTMVFRGKSSSEAKAPQAHDQSPTTNSTSTAPPSKHANPKAQDTTTVINSEGIVVAEVTTERGLAAIESEDLSTGALQVDTRGAVLTTTMVVLVLFVAVALWFSARVHRGGMTGVRVQVEALPISKAQEIEMIQSGNWSDSALHQPLSPNVVVRLQGRIVGGGQETLVAPLSKRECILFSSSVSALPRDGIHPPPLAFHSRCTNFTVALLDAPHVKLAVYGEDVLLFDMNKSSCHEELPFATAPKHWQEFATAHPAADKAHSSSALRADVAALSFREVTLQEGAVVTCVGEVRRGPDGSLCLWPSTSASMPVDPGGIQKPSPARGSGWCRVRGQLQPHKVLVSDDSSLLCTQSQASGNECKIEVPVKPLLPSGATAAPIEKAPEEEGERALGPSSQKVASASQAPPAQEFDAAMVRLKNVMRSALRECGSPQEPGSEPAVRTPSKDPVASQKATTPDVVEKVSPELKDIPDPWISWIHDQLPDEEV